MRATEGIDMSMDTEAPLTKKQGDRIIELLESLESLMEAKKKRWDEHQLGRSTKN